MQTLSPSQLLSRHRFYPSRSDVAAPQFGSLAPVQNVDPAPLGQEELRLVGSSSVFKGSQFTSKANAMLDEAIRACIGSSAEQMEPALNRIQEIAEFLIGVINSTYEVKPAIRAFTNTIPNPEMQGAAEKSWKEYLPKQLYGFICPSSGRAPAEAINTKLTGFLILSALSEAGDLGTIRKTLRHMGYVESDSLYPMATARYTIREFDKIPPEQLGPIPKNKFFTLVTTFNSSNNGAIDVFNDGLNQRNFDLRVRYFGEFLDFLKDDNFDTREALGLVHNLLRSEPKGVASPAHIHKKMEALQNHLADKLFNENNSYLLSPAQAYAQVSSTYRLAEHEWAVADSAAKEFDKEFAPTKGMVQQGKNAQYLLTQPSAEESGRYYAKQVQPQLLKAYGEQQKLKGLVHSALQDIVELEPGKKDLPLDALTKQTLLQDEVLLPLATQVLRTRAAIQAAKQAMIPTILPLLRAVSLQGRSAPSNTKVGEFARTASDQTMVRDVGEYLWRNYGEDIFDADDKIMRDTTFAFTDGEAFKTSIVENYGQEIAKSERVLRSVIGFLKPDLSPAEAQNYIHSLTSQNWTDQEWQTYTNQNKPQLQAANQLLLERMAHLPDNAALKQDLVEFPKDHRVLTEALQFHVQNVKDMSYLSEQVHRDPSLNMFWNEQGLLPDLLKTFEHEFEKPDSTFKVFDAGNGGQLYGPQALSPLLALADPNIQGKPVSLHPRPKNAQVILGEYTPSYVDTIRFLLGAIKNDPRFHGPIFPEKTNATWEDLFNAWQKFGNVMQNYAADWAKPMYADSANRVRRYAQVLPSDIYKIGNHEKQFHALMTYFVACSISENKEDFQRAINSLARSLKIGGLMYGAFMERTQSWPAGNTIAPSGNVTLRQVIEAFEKAGMKAIVWRVDAPPVREGDKGMIAFVAIRKKDLALAA